jgi:prenyltransferase beta subunit
MAVLAGGENPRTTDKREETTLLPKVWKMVQRSHVYLARMQNADGSFTVDHERSSDARPAPIAVTSLVCLSFMAGGNTPSCGPFRTEVKKGISYLIDRCDPETGIFHDDLDQTSKMHGQGFATLALAQAYGMFGLEERSLNRDRLEQALKKAVELVCRIQTEVGGWYYDPTFSSDHEGSITICIVQALRAARNAGIHVEKGVIDRALKYVRRSQKDNGAFRYRLNDDKTSYALTAAGVATLNATGEYDSKAIDRGLSYMQKKDPILNMVSTSPYPQYARFYAAQAYYQYKDLSIWKRWYPRLVDESRGLQRLDGSFPNPTYGSVYATAFTSLTLQVSFGYLPVFQR